MGFNRLLLVKGYRRFGSFEHIEEKQYESLSLRLASLPSYRNHRKGHRRIAQTFRSLGAGLTVIMSFLW